MGMMVIFFDYVERFWFWVCLDFPVMSNGGQERVSWISSRVLFVSTSAPTLYALAILSFIGKRIICPTIWSQRYWVSFGSDLSCEDVLISMSPGQVGPRVFFSSYRFLKVETKGFDLCIARGRFMAWGMIVVGQSWVRGLFKRSRTDTLWGINQWPVAMCLLVRRLATSVFFDLVCCWVRTVALVITERFLLCGKFMRKI